MNATSCFEKHDRDAVTVFDRLKIHLASKPWFWKFRAWFSRAKFGFERAAYKGRTSVRKAELDVRILGSFAWAGLKSLIWVVLSLWGLTAAEGYALHNGWVSPLDVNDSAINIDQLRLYSQLLTAIFSIYFATIGIILSSGYTRLRPDIIHMLTNEQVGSVYSRVLVLAAMFCLAATTMPLMGGEPGRFIYLVGTTLTLLSALSLFPLGQRLFNFFDLNVLVRSEVLPAVVRHIDGASNQTNSISLANHHSKAARRSLEQLAYIDTRALAINEGRNDTLTSLASGYTSLLLHYLQRKHKIDQSSYWFPRRQKHRQWFLAGDTATSLALQTRSQHVLVEHTVDHNWLENEIVDRLAGHIEHAFRVGDFDLALKLVGCFSERASAYADQFQFELGMRELRRFKEVIELALSTTGVTGSGSGPSRAVVMADTWAALGSNLCLESLRRMLTFESQMKGFFEADDWSRQSLRKLPPFMQVELAPIIERIEFETSIEGRRLSKPKYLQQLAVQRLLRHHVKMLPQVIEFYEKTMPEFVAALTTLKMSEAATQVVLASLHAHWKLPRWLDEISSLIERYCGFQHYTEPQYALPTIDFTGLSKRMAASKDAAIASLGSAEMVKHIFEPSQSDELPDHFGQIYFELAEACINATEDNDAGKLDKVLPMFMSLAFLAADSRFADPNLEVNDEFRLHLISTVINDLASVLGSTILYGAYFDNEQLSERALARFDAMLALVPDQQRYLKRMLLLSDPHSFSISASPRGLIRLNWKMAFENRARMDGFDGWMGGSSREQHPNIVVRAFLNSHSDASHLFLAEHVLPKVGSIGEKVDYQIVSLARLLRKYRLAETK